MAQPFLGEIRMFGGSFAPAGWAFCNGQLLTIAGNDALFTLIGTTYGGDGQETFALPNLQSRIPIHRGQGSGLSNYLIGETGGVEEVTLTTNQIPGHSHAPLASNTGGSDNPSNSYWADSALGKPYAAAPPNVLMNPQTITPTGGSQPHENMIPFLCVTYIIALEGGTPQPYLSEIRMLAFTTAPAGWVACNGQLLPIGQNQGLFSLLGTTYGGDGITTFALPDLRSRAPVHRGNSFNLGQKAGTEAHTISINELPSHTHQTRASADPPSVAPPTNNFWASNTGFTPYGGTADIAMSPTCISNVGGSQPHENRSPFLVVNFCIALQGVFPSQN